MSRGRLTARAEIAGLSYCPLREVFPLGRGKR